MSNKKYDPMIKQMITESGQPNLFPELSIPRTTALYWISKSKEVSTSTIRISENEDFYLLKKEVFKLKAEKDLLQKVINKALEMKPLQSVLGIEKKNISSKQLIRCGGF